MFFNIQNNVVELNTKNQIVAIFDIFNGLKSYDKINNGEYHVSDVVDIKLLKMYNSLEELRIAYVISKDTCECKNLRIKLYIPSWSWLTDDLEVYKYIFQDCKSEEDYILAEYVYACKYEMKKYIKYLDSERKNYSQKLRHYIHELKMVKQDYMYDFYEEHVGQM